MVRAGITCGDPNGIGPEVILKALSQEAIYDIATFYLFISPEVFTFWKDKLKNEVANIRFHTRNLQREERERGERGDGGTRPSLSRKKKEEAGKFEVFIIPSGLKSFTPHPGDDNPFGARYAIDTLKKAITALEKNIIDVLITGPWSKKTIPKKEFEYQGVTDYLAEVSGVDNYLMFMISDELKVGLLTEHIPVGEVPSWVTKETIKAKIELMAESLKNDFMVSHVKIGVCGVNPHAGDGGKTGEEDNIIREALIELRHRGIEAYGPFSADAYWGSRMWRNFSATLSIYHDQGLIPFKLLTGMGGVNYTAGLPIVRTAPCHGPAFDIAGHGKADPTSMINAIYYACKIYENRKRVMEWNANPLKRVAVSERGG